MTEERRTAILIARILRALSEKIEKNPGVIKEMGLDLSGLIAKDSGIEAVREGVEIDPFSLYMEEGESALRERLADLDLRSLKALLHHHDFDPSHFTKRWRDRDRVIDLIVKRVSACSEKRDKK